MEDRAPRPRRPRRPSAIERARTELEAGRAWRAREILEGAVSPPFDEEAFRAYGDLLLRLGDDLRAGRFLALVSPRDAAQDAAVELFLDRHRNDHGNALGAALPTAARGRPAHAYPPPLGDELARRGYARPGRGGREAASPGLAPRIAGVGCTLGAIVFAAAAATQLFEWAKALFARWNA